MTDLEIFLLILGIIIVIGIIIVVILAAVGVFEVRRTNNLLNGTFSWHPLVDGSRFVTTSSAVANKAPVAGDTLVTSNSSSVACGSYQWTFTNNFLELGTTGLVATVASKTVGTPIVLAAKGTAGDLNQWVYNNLDFTWCLKSDTKFCIADNTNNLILNNLSINQNLGWVITNVITTPSCT